MLLLHEVQRQTAEKRNHKQHRPAAALAWLVLWAAWFAAAVALYWPALRARYFSDDFLFFFTNPPAHLWDYFFRIGSAIHAYRPLEAILLTATQQHLRFDTLPIHLSALACHAGLACLLIAAARRFRMPVLETAIAAAALFFSQVGVSALIGNDTLSQSASAFFGWAAVLSLWRGGRVMTAVSVLCLGCSLFFKETGFGFLLALLLLVGYRWWRERTNPLPAGVPLLGMAALYFVARHSAGGMLAAHGRYGMHIGANIPKNLATLLVAAFSPVSTVTSGLALAGHHKGVLLACLAGAAATIAVAAWGVWKAQRGWLAMILVVLAGVSLFPTFLLEHVSELYVYNAVPPLALLMGLGFGALWRTKGLGRAAAATVFSLFLVGQMAAVRQKVGMMVRNGNEAAGMIASIQGYLPGLPTGSTIDLIRAATDKPTYSVFVLNGFDVLDYGNIKLGAVLHRPDVRIDIVEEPQAQGLLANEHLLLLGLDQHGAIERYAARHP